MPLSVVFNMTVTYPPLCRNWWWTYAYSWFTYCDQRSAWCSLCDTKVSHGPLEQVRDLKEKEKQSDVYWFGGLNRIRQCERYNKMGSSNLATIFGMTLMGDLSTNSLNSCNQHRLADTHLHVRVVQTILEHYHMIFEQDEWMPLSDTPPFINSIHIYPPSLVSQ